MLGFFVDYVDVKDLLLVHIIHSNQWKRISVFLFFFYQHQRLLNACEL